MNNNLKQIPSICIYEIHNKSVYMYCYAICVLTSDDLYNTYSILLTEECTITICIQPYVEKCFSYQRILNYNF